MSLMNRNSDVRFSESGELFSSYRVLFPIVLLLLTTMPVPGGQEARSGGAGAPVSVLPEWVPLTWNLSQEPLATRVSSELTKNDSETVQRFRLVNGGAPESIVLKSLFTPSLLHDDFEARVRIHSAVSGLRVGLLIVLPRQMDPRTRKPLQTILRGETLRETESWQVLRVTATRKAIEAQLRLVRAELNRPDIRSQEALVLGLVLVLEASPGETFFDVGPAMFGPVVRPSPELLAIASDFLGNSESGENPRQFIPLDVELNSMLLNNQPVVLRMAPDHSEHTETLRQLGLNAVWVPDFRATERARELYNAGVAVVATPPHPEFEPGDYTRLLESLPPLREQCPHVSAWYEGTRVSPEDLPHLLAWSREVRSADRVFQRLQMADVTAAEGAVAREIDLVGIGRHVVGRDESFGALRNLLIRRQKNGGQLSFPWMWIQTEPSSAQQEWRRQTRTLMPFVEPEQIQHQIYAALSAGYKGIGFWKTTPLQIDNPAGRETALAIELACLEIELLEPLLARGRLDGHLALQSSTSAEKTSGPKPFLNSALAGKSQSAIVAGAESPAGHDAAVISTDGTTLILATLWDDISQFVPGPMFEREVNLIVAASETASAWQISASDIRRFPRDVTAGGLSLKVTDIDRSAALLVTSDLKLIQQLEQRVHSMAERVASRSTELASLKYLRVLSTVETLREEHAVPSGIDVLLSSAKEHLDRAEFERSHKDFRKASLYAGDAMRILRQAQQACWKDAIAELSSPAASPHTISFSTLPDHWRMMHYLDQQSSRLSANLFPAGNFEDPRSIAQEGWTYAVPEKTVFSAAADKLQDSRAGRYLRLVTWQTDPATFSREEATSLLLTTPPLKVEPKDLVIVSGRLRRSRTSAAGLTQATHLKKPLVLFDSELGAECGLRPVLETDWTEFEIIRPIAAAGEFTFSLGLTGQAEVHLDDLRLRKLTPGPAGPHQLTGREQVAP